MSGVARKPPLTPLAIEAVGLLRSLTPAQATERVRGRTHTLEPEAVLFREGEPADHFFVVLQGTFEVARQIGGQRVVVSTFAAGEFGGEVPLLSGTPHQGTGSAQTAAVVFVMDAGVFWGLMESSPDVRTAILANMAVRSDELQRTSAEREMLVALGRVTAGIAHELQNPLNFVVGFAELTVEILADLDQADPETVLSPDAREALDVVARNARKTEEHGRRAAGIVRRMLDHVEALGAARVDVDLHALLGRVVADVFGHGETAVETDFAPGLPPVQGVPLALARVFRALLENAAWAVGEREERPGLAPARITMRTRPRPGGVEVEVSDNGVGVPAEHAGRVFEPFFTTRAGAEGSGLGLSLAYDIVTAGHSGSITLQSTEGAGATFTVVLPTAPGL